MKHTMIIATSIASLLLSANVMAHEHYRRDDDRGFRQEARVVSVAPIYHYIRVSEPHRECWDHAAPRRYGYRNESYTGTIAGGIIGGVLGNQFGGGSGRTVMTVAGTLLGGSIGHDMSYNSRYQQPHYRYEQTCRTTERYHNERVVDGYHVTYRYRGDLYATDMDHRPGRFIPVDVEVRPQRYRDDD